MGRRRRLWASWPGCSARGWRPAPEHRDRLLPLAVDLDLERSLALDRREGAAGLVVERQRRVLLARGPGLLPGAAGEDLGAGGDDAGAGGVGRAQRRHRLRQAAQGVDLAQLLLDRDLRGEVFALAEVGPGEGAAEAPEEEAGPALAAVGGPEVVLGVDRDRELDPEAGQPRGDRLGIGAEREARRLHPDHAEAGLAVAPGPLADVGQRPHAVELGEVDEVDERRAAGGQRRHRLRFVPDPGDSRRQVGGGDVVATGAQGGDVIRAAGGERAALAQRPWLPRGSRRAASRSPRRSRPAPAPRPGVRPATRGSLR